MKNSFRLDDHPRRPQPLASPPDGYFDRLPLQIMQRVRPETGRQSVIATWFAALSVPLRTALASLVLLAGFTMTFFLSQPHSGKAPASADVALAAVPRAQAEQYLLTSDDRVSLTDLAESTTLNGREVTESYLKASPTEVESALDSQPQEEGSYL